MREDLGAKFKVLMNRGQTHPIAEVERQRPEADPLRPRPRASVFRSCSRRPAIGSAPGRGRERRRRHLLRPGAVQRPDAGAQLHRGRSARSSWSSCTGAACKGYVTFNTLVFENEMAEAEDYLRAIIAAGVDAAIVQDVGICRLIRRALARFPDPRLDADDHHQRGRRRVRPRARLQPGRAGPRVLAQGNRADPGAAPAPALRRALPLEVFVHGALCVAYSGQCLTSEALGGRSANRGECAQACRMPYELIADGQTGPAGRPPLSAQPAGSGRAGACCPNWSASAWPRSRSKAGSRSPEYVANITRIYRQALDRMRTRVGVHRARRQRPPAAPHRAPHADPHRYDMEMAFSRGLYTGWFRGINNQELVHAPLRQEARRLPRRRSPRCGATAFALRLEGPLKPGDGVVFDAGQPEEKEEGGRVYEVDAGRAAEAAAATRGAAAVLLAFGRGDIDFRRVHAGDKVWKTSDPELDRRLRQSFAGRPARSSSARSRIEVHGRAGQPLTLIARDELGHVVPRRLRDAARPRPRSSR